MAFLPPTNPTSVEDAVTSRTRELSGGLLGIGYTNEILSGSSRSGTSIQPLPDGTRYSRSFLTSTGNAAIHPGANIALVPLALN